MGCFFGWLQEATSSLGASVFEKVLCNSSHVCRFIHHHDDDGGGTVCIFLLATIERRAKLVEEDSGRYQTVTGTTANGKERRAKLMKASLAPARSPPPLPSKK